MVLAALEFTDLLQAVWVSLVAGVVVTAAFAIVVRESARSAEARRAGESTAALVHGVLAAIVFAAFAAIVVVGLIVMLKTK
jgi:hypothetical protein